MRPGAQHGGARVSVHLSLCGPRRAGELKERRAHTVNPVGPVHCRPAVSSPRSWQAVHRELHQPHVQARLQRSGRWEDWTHLADGLAQSPAQGHPQAATSQLVRSRSSRHSMPRCLSASAAAAMGHQQAARTVLRRCAGRGPPRWTPSGVLSVPAPLHPFALPRHHRLRATQRAARPYPRLPAAEPPPPPTQRSLPRLQTASCCPTRQRPSSPAPSKPPATWAGPCATSAPPRHHQGTAPLLTLPRHLEAPLPSSRCRLQTSSPPRARWPRCCSAWPWPTPAPSPPRTSAAGAVRRRSSSSSRRYRAWSGCWAAPPPWQNWGGWMPRGRPPATSWVRRWCGRRAARLRS